ncbi:MAG TPA: tetratricopeptide repeat protein [Vicinamibacterales bacterium]|nr:tetratricopeptide repeat protein [Vicinamibacterales bacterium]
MHSRFALRAVVALLGVTLAVAGCGRYSFANLKAKKSFNEAGSLYARGDFRQAAVKYEEVVADPRVIENDPEVGGAAYFYLANSYDNLYKAARKGEPENDAHLPKAEANYLLASEKAGNELIRRRAIEYLVALYGPEKLNTPEKSEPLVRRLIEMEPNDTSNYYVLGKVYEDSARLEEAEQAYLKAAAIRPENPEPYQYLAGFYDRAGNWEKAVESMGKRAQNDPNNAEAYHQMAVWLWAKADKDFTLSAAEKRGFIDRGIEAENKALALNPDYFEALTYKNILLRLKANGETDRAKQAALIREADQIRDKAIAIQKQKGAGQ